MQGFELNQKELRTKNQIKKTSQIKKTRQKTCKTFQQWNKNQNQNEYYSDKFDEWTSDQQETFQRKEQKQLYQQVKNPENGDACFTKHVGNHLKKGQSENVQGSKASKNLAKYQAKWRNDNLM